MAGMRAVIGSLLFLCAWYVVAMDQPDRVGLSEDAAVPCQELPSAQAGTAGEPNGLELVMPIMVAAAPKQLAQKPEERRSGCELLSGFFRLCRCSGSRETWRRCCRHCVGADDI